MNSNNLVSDLQVGRDGSTRVFIRGRRESAARTSTKKPPDARDKTKKKGSRG